MIRHSFLLYYQGGIKYVVGKEFRRGLFFVLIGIVAVVGIVSGISLELKKRALLREISLLTAEYTAQNNDVARLEKRYRQVSRKYRESQDIRRVVTAINPWLSDDEVQFWVATVRSNMETLYRSLNGYSLAKMQSSPNPHAIDPGASLLLAVAALESDFNLNTRSGKGAYGPMQLRKITAEQIGVADRRDPHENINGGVRYLCRLLEKFYTFPDQLELALASYNAGRTRVHSEWIPNWGQSWVDIYEGLRARDESFRETRVYVHSIIVFSNLLVSGKWNDRKKQFWRDYKNTLRNTDLAVLNDRNLDRRFLADVNQSR